MILHLVSDHVATNSCLKIFKDELPNQNIILVFKRFGYQVDGGIVVNNDTIGQVVNNIDFSSINCVVVSFLTKNKIDFIKKYVPADIPLIWWTYGADFYARFLEIRGYSVFYSDPDRFSSMGIIKWLFLRLLRPFRNNFYCNIQNKYIIPRLTGFVPCVKPEYDLLCRYINKKIDLIQIHTYGASFKFDGRFSLGNDIALGHSASISDNHLYALEYLKQFDLGKSDLYITLSYSNKLPKYTARVKYEFEKIYGKRVHFIMNMLPKEEYFESQFRYKAMILPSWRQEALDNIYTCLQIGIKLILSERSILYKYLKDYGFYVFSLEQLNQNDLETPLEEEKKKSNQQLFEKFISERKRNFYSDFDLYFKNRLLNEHK